VQSEPTSLEIANAVGVDDAGEIMREAAKQVEDDVSATWRLTPVATSAERRLRPEVSKSSITALSSSESELARSITTVVSTMASLSPSPVMVLTPLWGEAATTLWPSWRRTTTVFDPIRPVPPITTIFMLDPFLLDKSRSIPSRRWCSTPFLALEFRVKFGALHVAPSC
jgi:hypothetical protein